MEETLGEVLGLLVVVAFAPQIAVHRLPVSLQQQLD
jgi:hypothetical protein